MDSKEEENFSIFSARNYQLEAFKKAKENNTIVYLETGSGKTLIAIMLLRHFACHIRKPSSSIAVFLVPKVVLVKQQAEAIKRILDLTVGMYWGDMGVDFWNAETWKEEIARHEVFVMTPQILLDCLRHSFLKMEWIQVLIIDECHHARGNHAYACIMTEFYHRLFNSGCHDLPRILGMTASPIKSKCSASEDSFWLKIVELENMLKSKVYTSSNDSEVAKFLPQSSPILVYYDGMTSTDESIFISLKKLELKYELSIGEMNLSESDACLLRRELSTKFKALEFCLEELGVKLAFEAAKFFSGGDNYFVRPGGFKDFYSVIKEFTLEAYHIFRNFLNNVANGASTLDESVTEKVLCLCSILYAHRNTSDIRCIVFVERIVTAVVLESHVCSVLQRYITWKSRYIAGSHSKREQNDIVKDFRDGKVNVIIATSLLEEGLDVQSCNLVIRFDLPPTMCSFIQSRGRARALNSNYVLMVKRDDPIISSKMEEYRAGAEKMRKISLSHADDPCSSLLENLNEDQYYVVESTGALATLKSSVATIYFYCSRLPSDAYFKPAPRFDFDKINQVCTLHLPSSSPVSTLVVHGDGKFIKEKACLEACKQLHVAGALTDNLVPDIVVETEIAKEEAKQKGYDKTELDRPIYFPVELVSQELESQTIYFCYIIKFKKNFEFEHSPADVVLAIKTKLDSDFPSWSFDLDADAGSISVDLEYIGEVQLSSELVRLGFLFQITLFGCLLSKRFDETEENEEINPDFTRTDYLLLPSKANQIDWITAFSVLCASADDVKNHQNCTRFIQTKTCRCMLTNSLVYTPHNRYVYYITGTLDDLNGTSIMMTNSSKTYYDHYKKNYNITLSHKDECLVRGRQMFSLEKFLVNRKQLARKQGLKYMYNDSPKSYVELPPELCVVIMHPISISTVYSFSFLPCVMHRIESLLIASSLKKLYLDDCVQNFPIPTTKILQAITTKKCDDKCNLEFLEALGDSFLKYTICQYLFNTHKTLHEGHLSLKKDKVVSNPALCKLACDRRLPGFVRDDACVPKNWLIPGKYYDLKVEVLSETKKCYASGRSKLTTKRIADVVESLIGAYLTAGGEAAALQFMQWIGIQVDLTPPPRETHFRTGVDQHINVTKLQALLNYTFKSPSLLLEALTHGSYMVPELPTCYQRLEFLGDAVLDYLITMHMATSYPDLSPGLLTDLRSASVNNNSYARCSLKVGLYNHLLHASALLHGKISESLSYLQSSSDESTFGFESDTDFPKVLGDILESVAGAIFVDSGYDKEAVYNAIVPLMKPLVSPTTLRQQTCRELSELCQKQHFQMIKTVTLLSNEVAVTLRVIAKDVAFVRTIHAPNKHIGLNLASKHILEKIKSHFTDL